MRLATIRTAAGHRAVRVDDGAAVETGDADVRALLAHPDWRARAEAAAGPSHALDTRRLRPARARPREDHLRRAELPRPRAGDGQRAARVPHRLRQVRAARWSARTTTSCCPASPTRSTGRPSSTVVIGRPVRHADAAAGGGGDRGLHGDERRQRARLPESHQAVPAGQDVRALHAARARSWSPRTSCPRAAGPSAPRSTARPCRARPPTSSCSGRSTLVVLPVADRHAEPRRRHRHRHAGRCRPRPQAPALPHRRHRGRHVRRGGRRAAQHLPRGEAVTGKSPPAVTDSLAWAADGAAHLRGLMSRLGDDAFRAPSLLPGLEPRARADPPRAQRRRHDQPAAVGADRDRHPRLRQRRARGSPTSRRARSARRTRSETTSSPRPTGWPPSCATCRKRPGRRWSPTCRAA